MQFTPFPKLLTSRLILRQLTIEDCHEVLFLRSDPETNQYVKRSKPKNLKDAAVFVEKISTQYAANQMLYWVIHEKGNPKMIGSICLWHFSEDRKTAEVGYDLHPASQGKGIMSEALKEVLTFGFETLGVDNVEAFTQRQNESSKRLLKKNGFVLLHDRKDEGNLDNVVFGRGRV